MMHALYIMRIHEMEKKIPIITLYANTFRPYS